MYFPETILSKNFFQKNPYEITRTAEKEVLSGKHGEVRLPVKINL
jgi:hypothetical protein